MYIYEINININKTFTIIIVYRNKRSSNILPLLVVLVALLVVLTQVPPLQFSSRCGNKQYTIIPV